MRGVPDRRGTDFRARGDDDGRNGSRVAGLMEVLEVERVVANLIQSGGCELFFPDLELNDEDHSFDERKDVDSLAKARNRILEVDRTLVPIRSERRFEDGDFFE